MPAKPNTQSQPMTLSIAKLIKVSRAGTARMEGLGVPGLSVGIKQPTDDKKPGVTTF